jgi:peptidoglycan/xylan/chitin deacetylase (PgdA/CDA1 family)
MRLPELFRRAKRKPSILMYHRIADLAHDPWGIAVAPDLFEAQMEFLSEECSPLSMPDFVERAKAGRLEPDHVALTIDDGYLDIATRAAPALQRYAVPATIFVITAASRKGAHFWWDELAEALLAREPATPSCIQFEGRRVSFDIIVGCPPLPGWRATDPPRNARERLFLDLYFELQVADDATRNRFFDELRQIFPPDRDGSARAMTMDELRKLSAGGLIALGGHTVTHPRLDKVSEARVLAELTPCLEELRDIFGLQSAGFAYPYGGKTVQIEAMVEDAGFAWACTTRSSTVEMRDRTFDLPRIAVGNWSAQQLRSALSGASRRFIPSRP